MEFSYTFFVSLFICLIAPAFLMRKDAAFHLMQNDLKDKAPDEQLSRQLAHLVLPASVKELWVRTGTLHHTKEDIPENLVYVFRFIRNDGTQFRGFHSMAPWPEELCNREFAAKLKFCISAGESMEVRADVKNEYALSKAEAALIMNRVARDALNQYKQEEIRQREEKANHDSWYSAESDR